MARVIWSLLLILLALAPIRAQADPAADAEHYTRCLAQARTHPDDGLEAARIWRDQGGGLPAEHCAAIALIGLKQYDEAAQALNDLAIRMVREPLSLRAETLSQAAEAWSEAGDPEHAADALSAAIKLVPDNPDYYVNRAVAMAQRGEYATSVEDLNHAIALGGPRADILSYRAAAYRLLKNLPEAEADANRAVQMDSHYPEAYLERGNLRFLQGDPAGARQDWLKILRLAPNSAAADAARDKIAGLDLKPDPRPAKH